MTIFCFLDTETTGLSGKKNFVLEVAWQLTDEKFNPVSTPRTFLVDHPNRWEEVFSQIHGNPFIQNMHTENGLIADLTRTDPPSDFATMGDIMHTFAVDVLSNGGASQDVRLAGYSIHFDRMMLKKNGWKELWKTKDLGFQMHHRLLDLSSVLQMYQAAGRPAPSTFNETPHRALPDALDALVLAQLMRDDIGNAMLVS